PDLLLARVICWIPGRLEGEDYVDQLAGLKCWQLGSSAEEGAFELEVFCGQLEAEVTTIRAAEPAINNAQTFYLEGGFGIGSTKRTEFPYLIIGAVVEEFRSRECEINHAGVGGQGSAFLLNHNIWLVDFGYHRSNCQRCNSWRFVVSFLPIPAQEVFAQFLNAVIGNGESGC